MTELDFTQLRETRAANPGLIRSTLQGRARRPISMADNRLLLIAADHPARGALGVGSNPMAMGDRYDLLERMAIALSRPGVDGVLATSDIIDDLALLGVLNNKIVVGSMNRGGLRGASFEMDDRYTAYTVADVVASGLDFVKALVRVNLSDPGTASLLESTARAVTEASAAGLPIMLEPFISYWEDGSIKNDLSTDAVVKSVTIASGLGSNSAYSWLKIPVVPDMDRVMKATTLPTLLLGGDASSRPEETYESWRAALALPGVRGLVLGRSMLYPADGDVGAAVDIAASLVHGSRIHDIPT